MHAPVIPLAALLAIYFAYQAIAFAVSGNYAYHTRTNLGRPINISIVESPVVFIGLCFVQLSIAALLAGWGTESAYHVLRILRPSLGWPRQLRFKPYRASGVLIVIGTALLALGVAYMVTTMLLHK